MVGGQALEWDRGGPVEVQAFGEWDQAPRRRDGVLCVPARPEQADHAVAYRNIVHPLPYLGHGAGNLGTWDERQVLGFHVLVAAAHRVGVVHACGADLDQDLPLARFGTLDIDVSEHLGLAELLDHYRFHLCHVASRSIRTAVGRSNAPTLPALTRLRSDNLAARCTGLPRRAGSATQRRVRNLPYVSGRPGCL